MRAETITKEYIARLLPRRKKDSSKRDNGKALLIAGSPGFSGAAVMASCAALRSGAGTLKTAVPRSQKGAFYALPEAMCVPYPGEDWDENAAYFLAPYIAEATAIAIGPGLGRGSGREEILLAVLAEKKPAVVDADGLFALSRLGDKKSVLHDEVVLTPHAGEMERLCGVPASQILARQEELTIEYAREWGCTVLLKGPESVIASPNGRAMRNISGNPGLAKGGSGDVLSGITLAMLSQGLSPFDAACAGAFILGSGADEAVELLRERMLLARDVIDIIELTIDKI